MVISLFSIQIFNKKNSSENVFHCLFGQLEQIDHSDKKRLKLSLASITGSNPSTAAHPGGTATTLNNALFPKMLSALILKLSGL
jgi:hypothetical protein